MRRSRRLDSPLDREIVWAADVLCRGRIDWVDSGQVVLAGDRLCWKETDCVESSLIASGLIVNMGRPYAGSDYIVSTEDKFVAG